MTNDPPRKNNVRSITQAIGRLSGKPKIGQGKPKTTSLGPNDLLAVGSTRKKRKKLDNTKMKPAREPREPKAPALTSQSVPDFPDVPGLDEEKAIIGKGIVDLNKALFQQTIYESERLGKIRKLLSKIEMTILDESEFDKLSPDVKLQLFGILRKDSETTINFLERMQRNSINIMLVFEIYKKLMETIKDSDVINMKGLPPGVDKSKILEVKGVLLDLMKSATN